jgi:Co/Zn/Cd efflux system component
MTATAHRHGLHVHAHPHDGAHRHVWHPRRSRPINDAHHRDQGHSHGLLDDSIKRSRAGLHAVGISLAVLGATAAIQAAIYVATGSVALLADLIHNFGDALTAVPLGAAFLLGSARAERWAGLAVVLAIFVSACVAGVVAIEKIITPHAPEHLLALGIAGAVGFAGNEVAAQAPSWYRPWARWPPDGLQSVGRDRI